MFSKIPAHNEESKYHNIARSIKQSSFIALVVSSYIVLSICMVIYNKVILNQIGGFPLTFLCGQLFVAVAVLRPLIQMGIFGHVPSLTMADLKELSPLISINVFGLCMNTLCLKYVDAMMYQVARSLVLPITLFLTYIQSVRLKTKNELTLATIMCCLIIFCGFVIGMNLQNMSNISPKGLLFSFASSMTTSCHSLIIKNSLSKESNKKYEAWGLVYVNNLLSCIILAPIAFFLEFSDLKSAESGQLSTLLYGTAVSGFIGLLINYTGFLQIHVTSPLTHTVSSAARGVFQSLVAKCVLGEVISIQRLVGIMVTLFGTTLYSLCKTLKI